MSKTLVCLTETLPFYAQEVCKDSYTSVGTEPILKSKTEKMTESIPQDENEFSPQNTADQMVLKRSLSRKREASNILMECVKRRENMQNMDYVPFDSNNCNFISVPSSNAQDVSQQSNIYSELKNQQELDDILPVNSSCSADSGIGSSKSSSPSHSLDIVSSEEICPFIMNMDEGKKASFFNSETTTSLDKINSKSPAISEGPDDLNLEETSQSSTDAKSPIIQSLFKNASPVLYFSTKDENVQSLPTDTLSLMKWKLSTITPVLIRETVLKCGFHLVDIDTTDDWLGTWGKHLKCLTFRKLKSFQKVNHYPGSFHLGRKDRLWNNIKKMQMKYGKDVFNFFPETFVLPADIKQLKKIWDEDSDLCWIKKPCASARGTGVKIIHKWSQVPKKRPAVVQRYISDPYLINGSKFDLRLYVLVPSFNPLRIYVFQDGLVRFASEKYSLSDNSFANKYVHLTNYSINKKSSTYTSNEDENVCQGHKWSLKSFWSYMSDSGIDVDKIKGTIMDMIIKTVISSEGPIRRLMKIHARRSYNCFELFGFDIMLDKDLQPWLLEVNISPSLHTNSALDLSVKGPLVKDMLNIAGFELPQKLSSGSVESVYLPSEGNRHQPISRWLTAAEKRKQSMFSSRYYIKKKVLDNLSMADISVLMETEDELNRRGSFVRVFPTSTSHKYFSYFDYISYYNVLLDAWEQTYGNKDEGIKYIQDFFDRVEKNGETQTKPANDPEDITITVH